MFSCSLRDLCVLVLAVSASTLAADWPEWRGPKRDGISSEKNLPERWSPAGENLAWKVPIGGRSTPVVFRDRVYLFTTSGRGETLQERLVCLDAGSGRQMWEQRFTVYLSDVPPHRIAWSSPAVDPETGNIYIFGVGGLAAAVSGDGKLLWQVSLAEDMGLITTHGGRTPSPVIDGDAVILSGISSSWGNQARAAHRFFGFDKRTGELLWISTPGQRPHDTTYSPPLITIVDGMRLFLVGGGDGAFHALKPQTGEPVWNYVVSKRGINTGVVLSGQYAILSHSEENLDTSDMGMLAAVDATAKGALQPSHVRWSFKGFQGGFSSPIIDGDRLLQVDNGANLYSFDVHTGKQLWQHNLGTIQKASLVMADGKLYVGSENGRFWILRARQDRAEVLDEDQLGTQQEPEAIIASVAVSDGRIFLVTDRTTYCIGRKAVSPTPYLPAPEKAPAGAEASHLQVVPAELLLKPGQAVTLRARLFDAMGRFLREEKAQWRIAGVQGAMAPSGTFTAASDRVARAGEIQATVGSLTGTARVRVIPALPLEENFEAIPPKTVPPHWVNTAGKYEVREMEGNKVLAKLADNAFTKRARSFFGHTGESGYTIEADVRAMEKRRQMGDAGVVAQRYQLTLFGNAQHLSLQPWQPETQRTVTVPFAWKPNLWYRLKLRVEPAAGGTVRARGKAWLASEPEPADWLIDRTDPVPNREGSPGIYADAPFEVYFDNLKVTPNP